MKLKLSEEKKGNLCFMMTWIDMGGSLQVSYFNTELGVLVAHKNLKDQYGKSLAIYRCCEVVE